MSYQTSKNEEGQAESPTWLTSSHSSFERYFLLEMICVKKKKSICGVIQQMRSYAEILVW